MTRAALLGLVLVACGDAFSAASFRGPHEGGVSQESSTAERRAPGTGGAVGAGGAPHRADASPDVDGSIDSSVEAAAGGAIGDARIEESAAPGAGGGRSTGGHPGTGGIIASGGRSSGGVPGSGGVTTTGGAPGTGGAVCAPKSCGAQGLECGSATDLCGAPLFCGSCQGLSCVSGHCECRPTSCPFCVGSPCCVSPEKCGCAIVPGGTCN